MLFICLPGFARFSNDFFSLVFRFSFFFPHTLFIYLPLAAASIFYMRSPRCTRSLCFLTRCHRHRRRRLRLRRRRRPVCTSICSNRFKMMATDLWWFISVHSPVRAVHRAPFRRHPYTLTQTARHTHTHTHSLSLSHSLSPLQPVEVSGCGRRQSDNRPSILCGTCATSPAPFVSHFPLAPHTL